MKKTLKKIAIGILSVIGVVVVAVAGYVIYISVQYYRIADNTPVEINNLQEAALNVGEQYTAVTYNIGFGAYDHDFSFFMDSGVMLDGTTVNGGNAVAESEEAVDRNIEGSINMIINENADFYLLQEVDKDATRSYHINECERIISSVDGCSSLYASNFHTAYLFYPLHEPHGKTESGLLSLSKYNIESAVRISYPVDESFPAKFFDLDRCFTLMRIPVSNGRQLVLINSHMSAYDEGGIIRAEQLKKLNEILIEEAEAGNYVIVGGDFNHVLCNTRESFSCMQQVPVWAYELDDSMIAQGYNVVCADNVNEVATCRSSDMAYQPGVNYTCVLDGFIISSNIEATAHNIDLNFEYSDHNPVRLTFTLK